MQFLTKSLTISHNLLTTIKQNILIYLFKCHLKNVNLTNINNPLTAEFFSETF